MPFYSQHWRDVQDDNHIWDHWLTSILQEVRIHSTAFDFPHQSHDKHFFCQRNTTILNVTNLKQSSSKTCATSHHWTEYLGHFSKTHLLAAVYVTLVRQIPWLHSGTGVYFITTFFCLKYNLFFQQISSCCNPITDNQIATIFHICPDDKAWCYVPNLMAINSLEFVGEQNEIVVKSELWWKNC